MIYRVQAYDNDLNKWVFITGHPSYDNRDEAIKNATIFKRRHPTLRIRVTKVSKHDEVI